MATIPVPMDDTVAMAMQQAFAQQHEILGASSTRAEKGDALIAEVHRAAVEQNADLNSKSASQTQQIVMAKTVDQLLDGGIGRKILDQNSVRDQPGQNVK
jgi:hypothetical protein